jgi:hypothetical protein
MPNYDQLTTIIVPTSPIPAHPDTSIIHGVLASLIYHFPASRVVITCDGVRQELAARQPAYDWYIRRLVDSVLPALSTFPHQFCVSLHDRHMHQAAMMREVIGNVDTPLVLFCEHDIAVRTDVPTDWQMMANAIMSGRVDLCRLMLHEGVHPEHEHLYGPPIDEYPYLRPQRQFSGWTHLASTAMYRRLLQDFNPRARVMIERYVGRVIEPRPWSDFKLTSYIPDPAAARRIYHLHGRGGVDGAADDPTFVETEIYPPR